MTVRILRPGSRVRGPQGDFLKPRVLPGASALEAALERVLESRVEARDLGCRVAILRFESRADGVHQTVAVAVPASELRYDEDQGQRRGRVQILVRVKDEDGRVVQRLAVDRPLQFGAGAARVGSSAFEQLVWTGHVHLPPGSYTAEALVLEPASGRATTQRLPFQVVAPAGPMYVSSVTLLQPRGVMFLAEPVVDDPLVVAGDPVMPTLDLVLPSGTSARFVSS